jgi:hypothetical protein
MAKNRSRWAAVALMAAFALAASGCGRSAGGAGSSSSGNISPQKDWWQPPLRAAKRCHR